MKRLRWVRVGFGRGATVATLSIGVVSAVACEDSGGETMQHRPTEVADGALLASYAFDEGCGSVATDTSGNGHAGDIVGASWTSGSRYGQALSFDGATGMVEVADGGALTPGARSTFSAWINVSAEPEELAAIVGKWDQTLEDEYLLAIDAQRRLFFAWHTTGADVYPGPAYDQLTSLGQVPLSKWTHVAVVRDSATIRLYIDGVEDTRVEAADASPFRDGAASLRIGAQNRGGEGRFFQGAIDEIRIYPRALGAGEILADLKVPLDGVEIDDAEACSSGCGNDICDAAESCSTCSIDCGACASPTCGDGACAGSETCSSCASDCGSCGGAGNIGDGDVQVGSIRRVMPDGFGSFEIFYALREPWSVDMTRMMFLEDANVQQPDGEWGLGLVWANVADLKSWTTVDEYRSIRHALNPYPYEYAGDFEWSPFPGEENILYAARLADRMVVKRNVDTGVEEDVVSYDPENGNTPLPLLRRWTTDNHLIVMLDGLDNLDPWINGVVEVDVQAKTRQYFPTIESVSAEDWHRWPLVSAHGHGCLNPDRTMYFGGSERVLYNWPDWSVITTYPPDLTYMGFGHVSWKSSNKWWITEDGGKGYPASSPLVDTFGLWQCTTDVTCKLLLDVQTATCWDPEGANWPCGPLPTLRKDGRQFIYVSTDGKYSANDFAMTGATPWGHRMLFLVDLEPL